MYANPIGDPFVVPPDTIFNRVTTMAVAPVTTDGDLTLPGDAVAKLEKALEESLERLGFEVVPAHEFIGVWQHISDGYAGFYDVHTGERDEEAYQTAIGQLRTDLHERFGVDGVVYAELWDGMVEFRDGVAVWDGTSQNVFGAYGLSGEVRALSLVVVLEDLAGNELFSSGFGFSTIEAWHNGDWMPLALEGVIGDSRLISRAVTGSLAPMAAVRSAGANRTP
jgi:hypothetical protein